MPSATRVERLRHEPRVIDLPRHEVACARRFSLQPARNWCACLPPATVCAMGFAVVLAVLALLAALCGRLGARSPGSATRIRVLALPYGVAIFEALTVAGAPRDRFAFVLVALAACISWRVPGRVQGWTADVGEVIALGSAS